MSVPESAIPAASAPPPAAPAAPSAPVASAPSDAPSAPATAPDAASQPGGPPSAQPSSLNDVFATYRQKEAAILAQGEDGEQQLDDFSAQPDTPEAPAEGDQPQQPEIAAQPPEVDTASLDAVLTPDQLSKIYHVPKAKVAELAAREEERGQLRENVRTIGGSQGVKIASQLNPIIWKENPTPEDAEAFLDQLVLPENAGAMKLVRHMGRHFVSTALYEDTPGPDGTPLGQTFANSLIQEEWGTQPDNKTPYDLPFVDGLIKAHKSWGVGPDGKPVDVQTLTTLVSSLKKNGISVEQAASLFRAKKLGILAEDDYINSELSEHPEEPEHEPTPRELELQAQLDEAQRKLQGDEDGRKAKAEADKAAWETRMKAYETTAKTWLSNQIMARVLPSARKVGWAAVEGEDNPSKVKFGELIATTIDTKLKATADYETANNMIKPSMVRAIRRCGSSELLRVCRIRPKLFTLDINVTLPRTSSSRQRLRAMPSSQPETVARNHSHLRLQRQVHVPLHCHERKAQKNSWQKSAQSFDRSEPRFSRERA